MPTAASTKQPRAPRKAAWLSARVKWAGFAATIIALALIALVYQTVDRSLSDGAARRRAPTGQAEHAVIAREVNALLDGIPQRGASLGRSTSPITLQVFLDLECLTSKVFVLSFLPSIIHDWVRTGIVRLEFHSRETDTLSPRVFVKQQMAALAAGAQGKLWNFAEVFYHEQGREYTNYVTEQYLEDIAGQVPALDVAKWSHDRDNELYFRSLVTDRQIAVVRKLGSTPAFLVGRTGGTMKRLSGYEMPELPGSIVDALSLRPTVEALTPNKQRRR